MAKLGDYAHEMGLLPCHIEVADFWSWRSKTGHVRTLN